MRLKLTVFHSLTLSIFAYLAYFYNAIELLWTYEQTKVSFVIMAIYAVVSFYLFVRAADSNFAAVQFQKSELTAIGLLGTVVGIGLLGASAAGDIGAFKNAVIEHLATIFIPSAFGIGFSILLGQQLSLCLGEHD